MTLLTRLSTRLILAGCLLAPASWVIAQAPRPAATHQDLRSEGFFEEVHAVKLPLRRYGYRGLMGDIVELNDSRLLMTYTQYDSAGEHTGGIAGRASTDQGRSWGPEFGLVARPNPPGAAGYHHPSFLVHPVNGEVPPVKGRPWKLPHYANRGKTTSSGGELASARSCFSTVRTALGKLRITGLLAQFDVARSFPQFPRPLLLQPTILTSERGTRFGIRKAPNHVPTSPFTG